MEPMLLGSPISPGSASSPGAPSTPAASFLPSFLLGDTNLNCRIAPSSSSPGSSRHHYGSGGHPGQLSPNTSSRDMMLNYSSRLERAAAERGPPVQSLGRSPAPSSVRLHSPMPDHLVRTHTPMGSPATPMRGSHQPSESFLNSSLISYEVHGESAAASTGSCEWVTVFGFPVASASFILTQFAQVGTIADQRLPGSGNWMHLRYQTPLEARKALALNGKILSSSIMIGVIPCTDASLLASTTKNLPLASSVSVGNTSASFAVNSPKAGIRSLTQSYAVTPTDNQVLTAASTPKKNDSFMSKAMQHILGV
ncbi:nucleoporin NUP35 [Hyalella azteca]|uniref:Nucleoporin NUP53 n=1 Tax=Hyalella azteca TaxID=294128 RepID=A0A8B7NKM8_HYAAZ|nr:nucleoporin NUP35 [Hyalella azteca]